MCPSKKKPVGLWGVRKGGFIGQGNGKLWSCVAVISSPIFDVFFGFVAVGVELC